MGEKREKQTDLRGTVGDFAGVNDINENTESDENSPKYKKWREEKKSILTPSYERIGIIEEETTNNGKEKRRGRSLNTTSNTKGENTANKTTREEQNDVIINKKKVNEPKAADGREMGE